MKPSIQKHLNVSSRTALQSAEAFLIPYKEVFQFVEDIINIKINYALCSGDTVAANKLVHLGIAGSIMTGLLASIIASILGSIPPVLQALTNPGLESDLELYPDCSIIAQAGDSQDLLLKYWMIEVWKFPGTQVAMVLAGFMYGAMEYNLAGWIMALGWGLLPLVWFGNLSKPIETLVLLALAEFSVPYLIVVLSVLYLVSHLGSNIREDTGVKLSFTRLCKSFYELIHREQVGEGSAMNSGPQMNEGPSEKINEDQVEDDDGYPLHDEQSSSVSHASELIKEGLCIMFLDVCVQLAKTLAIYLALKADGATAYQLTALDSELPSYGIAYTTGMAFAFKITGPIFLTIQEYSLFFKMVGVYLVCAFLLIPLIIGATVPFREGLSLESGQNSCEYAFSNECVPFFTNVFGPNATGGTFTLNHTYNAFSFGTATESVYIVARAIILTMLDFGYIIKSTMVAMIFYIVAITVACRVKPFEKEAISLWIAMYVPQVVLILLFLGRFNTLFRRMVRGELKGAMRSRFRAKTSRGRPTVQTIEQQAS